MSGWAARIDSTLRRAQFGSDFRLINVVGSGGTTAHAGIGDFHQAQIGNGSQQRSRLATVALRMQQMAGVLIDNAALAWKSLHLAQAQTSQVGAEVDDFGREGSCARGIRLALEEQLVVFHAGAAAGCCGNNGIHVFRDAAEVAPGEVSGAILLAPGAAGLSRSSLAGAEYALRRRSAPGHAPPRG